MRVFLAGATGAIGRPLVSQLIDAGHEVTGITRSQEGAAALEWAGAHAVVCDALLAEPLAGAAADAKPEVVGGAAPVFHRYSVRIYLRRHPGRP